jgi:hypothetical protein
MKFKDIKPHVKCDQTFYVSDGYEVKGNKEVVSFYLDFDTDKGSPMRVYASSTLDDGTPVIYLEYTAVPEEIDVEISFPELKGYDFFCASHSSQVMKLCFRK